MQTLLWGGSLGEKLPVCAGDSMSIFKLKVPFKLPALTGPYLSGPESSNPKPAEAVSGQAGGDSVPCATHLVAQRQTNPCWGDRPAAQAPRAALMISQGFVLTGGCKLTPRVNMSPAVDASQSPPPAEAGTKASGTVSSPWAFIASYKGGCLFVGGSALLGVFLIR